MSKERFCHFCNSFQEFDKKKTCKCGKIEEELYCPITFDDCRICNARIAIATGQQEPFLKNGYCSLRCAGEETYAICR